MWREHRLPRDDHALAWFAFGDPSPGGAPLVLLNGGPGDDHRYLRPVAERLAAGRACVLYDQRGCGASRLDRLDGDTLHIDRFVADLDALREALGVARIDLFGHSWGALLALLYAIAHPGAVARQVLVGMGPLSPALADVATANLHQPLTEDERRALAELRAARKAAAAAGDWARHAELHIRQMRDYAVRAWFFDPAAGARFADAFAAGYGYNPHITPHVWPTVQAIDILARAAGLAVPTLVVYGEQDFEPTAQAYLLGAVMPHVTACLINRCGHVPWLEQADAFYGAVERFLADGSSPAPPPSAPPS